MPGIDFRAVAGAISCSDFAQRWLQVKHSRARCPWHDGQGFNLALYPDGGCYCFVCHKGGDAVELASQVWHVSRLDAAKRLNEDFGLGLCEGGRPTGERVLRLAERDQRREDAEQALKDAEREAAAAWADAKRCEGTPDFTRAIKLATNADLWLRFKRLELEFVENDAGGE